ncbi:MAG: 16S rRNA (cytosine(967)-C(5))-methyltransferase RsmB [Clostridiales bacterium]|nr:16S rRNA (cytosine(967)-C(5))-methyltransferase RsmB [Clostridiales bacterium]
MADENLRMLAVDMLMEVSEHEKYSHVVLRQTLEKHEHLPKRDRAFLTRLFEGTIERQITLDFVIDYFSKTKVKKMKPLIREILRMSAYQIMYMDSVPDSAACNEAVKLAKKRGLSGLSGFTNGVLRAIAAGWKDVKFPSEDENLAYALSVKYAMPEWIVSLWISDYGIQKTREILKNISDNKNSGFYVRVNTGKITLDSLVKKFANQGIAAEKIDEISDALCVSGADNIENLPGFSDGEFYVQDISSMRVAHLAGAKEGDFVIDVCAAPGGKALHVAQFLRGSGMVEARDISEAKVALIEENRKRMGVENLRAVVMDATAFDENSVGKADVLICDLPCSGLGVMRKKPDIRHRMTESQAAELAALQQKILGISCNYLKPGGTLIYSTCTIHRAENEENVEWFLKDHPQFELISEEQIFPGENGGDGFFIAKLCKRK